MLENQAGMVGKSASATRRDSRSAVNQIDQTARETARLVFGGWVDPCEKIAEIERHIG